MEQAVAARGPEFERGRKFGVRNWSWKRSDIIGIAIVTAFEIAS
jgi:hypothetical protein